jgi:hypothetical protein
MKMEKLGRKIKRPLMSDWAHLQIRNPQPAIRNRKIRNPQSHSPLPI